jgi:hypothetical protein
MPVFPFSFGFWFGKLLQSDKDILEILREILGRMKSVAGKVALVAGLSLAWIHSCAYGLQTLYETLGTGISSLNDQVTGGNAAIAGHSGLLAWLERLNYVVPVAEGISMVVWLGGVWVACTLICIGRWVWSLVSETV